MANDWVTIPETDEWETVPEAEWETIDEGPLLPRVGGALVRGGMRTFGEAPITFLGQTIQQVKMLPMATLSAKVLQTEDPEKR
ncbi:unnamed protein product, partial [marine sediment metagenome]